MKRRNFFRRERFSRQGVRWRAAEATDVFFRHFPGFPFLRGHEVEELSISNILPPSIRKEFSSDGCVGGDVVQQRRGVEILKGVEPEA